MLFLYLAQNTLPESGHAVFDNSSLLTFPYRTPTLELAWPIARASVLYWPSISPLITWYLCCPSYTNLPETETWQRSVYPPVYIDRQTRQNIRPCLSLCVCSCDMCYCGSLRQYIPSPSCVIREQTACECVCVCACEAIESLLLQIKYIFVTQCLDCRMYLWDRILQSFCHPNFVAKLPIVLC